MIMGPSFMNSVTGSGLVAKRSNILQDSTFSQEEHFCIQLLEKMAIFKDMAKPYLSSCDNNDRGQ
jgi:hypothetical protein